ncbi:MAG: hypothetical protein IPL65_15580 [Lewinellaceae bacterium]|nr:hypothetical protein [Lewinellaceae bacterium]
METPITLYVHGYDLKKCTARLIGTGTMTGEEGHYRVGKSDRNEVDIEIAFDNEGTEQILTRQHYRIENLPDPTMFFANKKSGDITKEQLLGGTVLQAVE